MQLRKESLKKSGLPGFEPWPLRYRCSALTNWANKPTGSWLLNWFVIYPGKIKMKLCADQFETSTSPPPGKPRAIDCASCPGRGEFERCLGGVGNLNRIYLLFWRNTPVSFFGFWQGLTDLQDRISPLLVNNSFKRVFKRSLKVSFSISLSERR